MSDQNVTNQEPEPVKQDPQPTPTEAGKTDERKFTQAELDAIVKERLDRERKAREKVAADEKAKHEAETMAKNAEWEKLAKQREDELAKLQADIKARDLRDKRRAIGQKAGLPDAIADRLTGETDEELEADAKAILEALPKGALPKVSATNPGQNARGQGESDAERRKRLFGGS